MSIEPADVKRISLRKIKVRAHDGTTVALPQVSMSTQKLAHLQNGWPSVDVINKDVETPCFQPKMAPSNFEKATEAVND